MMCIRFKIRNEYSNVLAKILESIGIKDYLWKVVEHEIYNIQTEDLFDKQLYSNQEFKSIIENNIYYPIFANIQLYHEDKDIVEIQTYKHFINSNCKLILFITDNVFVDIYVKEEKDLNVLYNNAINNNFLEIRCIRDNQLARKKFSSYFD